MRNTLAKYIKKVQADVVKVDNAITKGAYLSAEEWFDFNFKSSLVGYHSKNILKYKIFNSQVCKFADAYADAFKYLLNISTEGFVNTTYIKNIKRVATKMSKFTSRVSPLEVDGYDRNGTLYIELVFKGGKERVFSIKSKNDAIHCLLTITGYCTDIADTFSHNDEFGIFIEGFLGREFKKFVANVEPTPYVCGSDRLTLAKMLSSRQLRVISSCNDDIEEERIVSIV